MDTFEIFSIDVRRRIKGILMSGKQFSLDSHLDLFHGIDVNTISRPTSLPPNAPAPLLEDSHENDEELSASIGIKY